jgi:hypothetical protein
MAVQLWNPLPTILTRRRTLPVASKLASVVCCVHKPHIRPGSNLGSVPANCSTPFWDPVKGQCLCTSSTCQFQDNSRPIGVSHLLASLRYHHLLICCSLTVRISLAAGPGVRFPPGQRPQQVLTCLLMEMAQFRRYLVASGWQSCLGSLVPCWGLLYKFNLLALLATTANRAVVCPIFGHCCRCMD